MGRCMNCNARSEYCHCGAWDEVRQQYENPDDYRDAIEAEVYAAIKAEGQMDESVTQAIKISEKILIACGQSEEEPIIPVPAVVLRSLVGFAKAAARELKQVTTQRDQAMAERNQALAERAKLRSHPFGDIK